MNFPKSVIRSVVALACLFVFLGCEQPVNRSDKPNILLIVADDLGYNDVAIYNNNTEVHTPTIDDLASGGVRFTRHYTDSTCSPSRAALLSGMFPARLGFTPNGRGIDPDLTTLPEALSSLGYVTHHVGKWHIGDTTEWAWPENQGYGSWFGFLNQWYLAGKFEAGKITSAQPRYWNPWLRTESQAETQFSGHLTDILTEHAVSKIEAFKGGLPWFINLSFYAPHTPISPSSHYASQYPDLPTGKYLAVLHHLDSSVAELVDALERTGQRENTLIIFVSDNGGTGEHYASNAPFPSGKPTLEEGGIRTPLIFNWPERLAPSITDEVAAIYDIYPTIMGILGEQVNELDGVDLTPALHGGELEPRYLFWERYIKSRFGYAVLSPDARWKYVQPWPWFKDHPGSLSDLNNAKKWDLGKEKGPAVVADLHAAFWQWQNEIHRMRLRVDVSETTLEYSGNDFQRTPGFGGFTVAVALKASAHLVLQPLISQKGVLNVSHSSVTGDLEVSFASEGITVPWAPENDCVALVVSGDFQRKLNHWKRSTEALEFSVYIDGHEAGAYERDGQHLMDAFSEPTLVNREGVYNEESIHFFNTRLPEKGGFSVGSVSRDLCKSG